MNSLSPLIVIAILASRLVSTVPDENLALAKSAYIVGNFQEAASRYEAELSQHGENPEIHYNLGNASYRLEHLGWSIYHYRVALRQYPGLQDREDAARNLDFVRNRRIDRVQVQGKNIFAQTRETICSITLRASGFFTVFTVMNFIFFAVASVWILTRRRRRINTFLIVIAPIWLIAGGVLVMAHLDAERDFRVVIEPKVDVFSAPNAGMPILAIHDGLEVQVHRSSGEWREVVIGDGTIGWVRASSLTPRIGGE